ncbi:RNA polymerase sigma factor, partial [Falsiroseomonas oryziterrae]|uniref:RNA polymerase sigma factor n=1 Tax=Falsiroseomonas oryziterrae TaxID=2911368 RepID=UPI002351129B
GRGSSDLLEVGAELPSGAPAADDDVAARREAATLRAALEELPLAQRSALRLTKIEELSLAEASGRSGMTVGALKVATHRAIRSLRRRFGVQE